MRVPLRVALNRVNKVNAEGDVPEAHTHRWENTLAFWNVAENPLIQYFST